jgi:hypothetical protein
VGLSHAYAYARFHLENLQDFSQVSCFDLLRGQGHDVDVMAF